MRIINKTKNTILAEEAIIADTLFERLKGLLGKKELNPAQALILEPCNSIHTFFMRFPIDVLFIDRNNRVIKAIPFFRPFRLTPIYFHARFAIELPCGRIKSTSTSQADIILIE